MLVETKLLRLIRVGSDPRVFLRREVAGYSGYAGYGGGGEGSLPMGR